VVKGDVMSSDAYSENTLQHNSRLLRHGFTNSIHATSYDKIEMNIGQWYLDEFGNQSREIRAHDADEETRIEPEPRRRVRRMRTAARLIQLLTP
jgi:hypothetical protein